MQMPRLTRVSLGVEQQVGQGLRVNATYARTWGRHLLRGRNVNAPVAGGARPDPSVGNVTEVGSVARSLTQSVGVNMNYMVPWHRTFFAANYTLGQAKNEADGPFSLPADNYDLAAEWGPSATDARHRVYGMFNMIVWKELRTGVNVRWNSALPYTITTGFDTNGDSVSNDRPPGVTRNSARGAGQWDLSARLGWTFGFGERQTPPGGEQVIRIIKAGGDSLGGFEGGASDKRWRFEIYLAAQNLFNHANLMTFSGVMTSPFFGRATSALPARRLDLGIRFSF
jgi:hypothetical protein